MGRGGGSGKSWIFGQASIVGRGYGVDRDGGEDRDKRGASFVDGILPILKINKWKGVRNMPQQTAGNHLRPKFEPSNLELERSRALLPPRELSSLSSLG